MLHRYCLFFIRNVIRLFSLPRTDPLYCVFVEAISICGSFVLVVTVHALSHCYSLVLSYHLHPPFLSTSLRLFSQFRWMFIACPRKRSQFVDHLCCLNIFHPLFHCYFFVFIDHRYPLFSLSPSDPSLSSDLDLRLLRVRRSELDLWIICVA